MHGTFKSELGTLLNFALSSAMADPGALIELNAGAGWRPHQSWDIRWQCKTEIKSTYESPNRIELKQATRFIFSFLVRVASNRAGTGVPRVASSRHFLALMRKNLGTKPMRNIWNGMARMNFSVDKSIGAIGLCFWCLKSVLRKMTRHLDARNRLLKKREWSAQCCPWCLGCRVWINWRLPTDVVLWAYFTLFSFHSVRLHPASFSWENGWRRSGVP